MERKRKAGIRLNLFDTVVLIIALAVGAAVLWLNFGGGLGGTSKEDTVRYEIKLYALEQPAAECFRDCVGETLIEGTKWQELGTVESVEIYPATTRVKDEYTGAWHYIEVPDQLAATVVVTAKATETDEAITLASGFEIRAGTYLRVQGPGYYASGYIMTIERE